jgi:hypothetical protein
MSTQINHYVLWGCALPSGTLEDAKYELVEAYMDSAFNDKYNPRNGITLLWGEEYALAGHVISKSGDHEPLDLIEIPTGPPSEATSIEREIGKLCGLLGIEEVPPRKWIVLGHYR